MRAFDMGQVEIVLGSDIRAWPVTATVDQIDVGGGTWCIRQTRQHFWPAHPFDTAYQDGSLWVFADIGGRWVGGAADRFRPGQQCKGFPYGETGANWFTDGGGGKHEPLTSWTPQPGEIIGVCVSTPARFDDPAANQPNERSGVVFVAWPADANGPGLPIVAREGDPSTRPAEPPPAPPVEPPPPAPLPGPGAVDYSPLIQSIQATLEAIHADLAGLRADVESLGTAAALLAGTRWSPPKPAGKA